jgi:hypothetical protein
MGARGGLGYSSSTRCVRHRRGRLLAVDAALVRAHANLFGALFADARPCEWEALQLGAATSFPEIARSFPASLRALRQWFGISAVEVMESWVQRAGHAALRRYSAAQVASRVVAGFPRACAAVTLGRPPPRRRAFLDVLALERAIARLQHGTSDEETLHLRRDVVTLRRALLSDGSQAAPRVVPGAQRFTLRGAGNLIRIEAGRAAGGCRGATARR